MALYATGQLNILNILITIQKQLSVCQVKVKITIRRCYCTVPYPSTAQEFKAFWGFFHVNVEGLVCAPTFPFLFACCRVNCPQRSILVRCKLSMVKTKQNSAGLDHFFGTKLRYKCWPPLLRNIWSTVMIRVIVEGHHAPSSHRCSGTPF